MKRCLFILAFASALSFHAQAQFYKCVDSAGSATYQQTPCADSSPSAPKGAAEQAPYRPKSPSAVDEKPSFKSESSSEDLRKLQEIMKRPTAEERANRERVFREARERSEASTKFMGIDKGVIAPLLLAIGSLVVVALGVGWWLKARRSNEAAAKALHRKLRTQKDFWPTQEVLGINGQGLAYNDKRRKLCLFSNAPGFPLRIIQGSGIVSASIYEDGAMVTSTNRGSQLGGAIVGGALLGGAGAIIGGLSGKTTGHHKVTRVELRVVLNDTRRPMHDVVFIDLGGTGLSDLLYKQASQAARHWNAILAILLREGAAGVKD